LIYTVKSNAFEGVGHGTDGRILHNSQLREIRHLDGKRSQKDIAHEFAISVSHVSATISRRKWGNLP
jgi:hypothetical protein